MAYRWPPMLYRHLYDRQRKKQTKPRRLFHPHHMLLPRTLRCSQLNLNQQRLACESFPISSTPLSSLKSYSTRLVELAIAEMACVSSNVRTTRSESLSAFESNVPFLSAMSHILSRMFRWSTKQILIVQKPDPLVFCKFTLNRFITH